MTICQAFAKEGSPRNMVFCPSPDPIYSAVNKLKNLTLFIQSLQFLPSKCYHPHAFQSCLLSSLHTCRCVFTILKVNVNIICISVRGVVGIPVAPHKRSVGACAPNHILTEKVNLLENLFEGHLYRGWGEV